MLDVIKRIFSTQETIISNTFNEDLVSRLYELSSDEYLDEILLSPVSKIMVINTYYSSISDLIDNLQRKNVHREIMSVNLYSYFRNRVDPISVVLSKLHRVLESIEISQLAEHDLYSIIEAYRDLKEIYSKDQLG